MQNAVYYNCYKIKKGASVPDLLQAAENLWAGIAKHSKGYISYKLLADGDTWADFTIFETIDDAKAFSKSGGPKELAEKFFSFLNLNACITHFFTIEKSD